MLLHRHYLGNCGLQDTHVSMIERLSQFLPTPWLHLGDLPVQ